MSQYKTLTKLATGRTSRPILNTVLVQDGFAHATDCDTLIVQRTELPDGLYNGHGFGTHMQTLSDRDPHDFPCARAMGDMAHSYTLDRSLLLNWLAYLAPAMSTETAHYHLNGVYMQCADMVATDGHRLHKVESGLDIKDGIIIPRDAIARVIMLMKEHKSVKDVELRIYERGVVFDMDVTRLESRLVEGTYPAWQRVVPDYESGQSCEWVQSEWKGIVKDNRVLCKALGHKRAAIALGSDGVHLCAGYEGSQLVQTTARIEGRRIGLNADYCKDIPDGVMYYEDGTHPIKVNHKNGFSVLMPVRV